VWTVPAEESTEAVVAHLDNLRLDRRSVRCQILRAFFRTYQPVVEADSNTW
jgi:hypothetical protein